MSGLIRRMAHAFGMMRDAMIVHAARSPSPASRTLFKRSRLLVGASLVVLLGAVTKADARGLGGGNAAGVSNPTAVAAAAAAASAQQSSAAGQRAIQSMARAAQSLQAIRDAQSAARAAALAATGSAVPNGLAAGGLVVAPGAGVTPDVWVGANTPTQAHVGGRTQVEIKQTETKAILNWSSFNVGRETDVYFNQTAGGADKANWIALNRVTDPSLAPSRILGTIKAEGQVYVINKNGIVFGGASQVNVNSFVASSLSLSNEQFRAGINAQLFVYQDDSGSSIAKPQFGYLGQTRPNQQVGLTDPAQVAGAVIGEAPGDVRVEAGAQLTMASGGKALVFAPRVFNDGRISAPDGQVILAAGEQVYLAADINGVRGLDIAVSAPMRWMFDYYHMATASGQTNWENPDKQFIKDMKALLFPEMQARAASVGYTVVNNGMVSADHGNITLTSRNIVQNGALEASTALNNREGSIRLRAWDQGMLAYASSLPEGSPLRYWATGTLTLGSGSVTTAMPDLTDTSEIEQTSLATRYSPGKIELRGKLIDIGSAANVIVPAGKISIVASTRADTGETPITGERSIYDGSRVYIGEDAYLSVAGLQDVLLTMESNVVTGEFRINELRDSPLYRDSWLRGKSVSVDKRVSGLFGDGPMAAVQWIEGAPGKWVGTPLGDFSGWIGVGKTTLGELSTNAGSILVKSSGDFITRQGSLLDVSGGSVRYQDGWITTTKLVGIDGRIYDIGKTMPDHLYVGFAGSFSRTHNSQGKTDTRLTETWTTIFDRGVNRRFERGYVEGRAAGEIRFYVASGLVLDGSYWGGVVNGERQLTSGDLVTGGKLTVGALGDEYGRWLIGDLIITDNPVLLPAGFTSSDMPGPRWGVAPVLKPPLADPNDPTKEIPRDPSVPDNWIEPTKVTYLSSDVLAESGIANFNLVVRNSFTLAKGERLELAPATSFSVTVNSSSPTTTFTVDGSIRIAGGSVIIAGAKIAHFGSTASVDVSGEWRNGVAGGQPPIIKGGSIRAVGDLAPGAIFDVSGGGWYDTTGIKPKLKLGDAGALSLSPGDVAQLADLDLRGYSMASGGTLSVITSGWIQIGGTLPADAATGWLPGTLFAERGFRSFELTTTGDITVADGAIIAQIPQSIDLTRFDPSTVPTGALIHHIAPLATRPLAERMAGKPTSLGLIGDNVVIGAGAVISTDVGGSISLVANGHDDPSGTKVPGNLTIRGTVDAPAGTITLTAGGDLTLMANARIIARGAVVTEVSNRGLRSGEVRAGGTVSFNNAAKITLETGSLVDVSGTSGMFDHDGARNASDVYALTSDGGTISLNFRGNATDRVDATFLAQAGGAGSVGGTLNLAVGTVSEPTTGYLLPTTLYYIDRTTGAIKALAGTGNLDLYAEYSSGIDTAFRLSGVRLPIRNGTQSLIRGGGLAIVDAYDGGAAPTISQPLASVLTTHVAQLALLNKYFYLDSAATVSVASQLPSVTLKMTSMSAAAINGGGFGSLNVNATAFMIAPGVDLSFGKSAAITGTFASGGAGAASLTAPYIRLLSGNGAADAAGTGKLTLTADLIDVTRATFSGFAETSLVTGDLRLGGLLTDLTQNRTALLSADGKLELRAAQIYPATGILATVKAGARIDVVQNGESGLPLSAAGTLTLEAPAIAQNGTVRAPFGSIVFQSTDSITLGAGSVTSVSGDGLILPYGTLANNEFWIDPTVKPTSGTMTPSLSKLPEKNIILQGPKVTLAAGSVVDIRGGGDLISWEHVPGPGGSHDVLAQSGVYAILPGMQVSGAAAQKVWLAGGNGLAAGWYDLLPARYALLPGAFAVSMVKNSTSTQAFTTLQLADGATLMTGLRADAHGSGRDQLSSSWRVMSGATLRSYSEYNEATANAYFASDLFKLGQYRLTGVNVVTPRLTMDGGSVVFKASSSLVLDGTLQSQPAEGGRGGLVDIAGSKIAIVGAGQDRSDLTGYLVVDATSLSNFGAGSLLIGGMRSVDARGTRVAVSASNVLVRNDASSSLFGSEIVLAANGTVQVADGSVIVASGNSPGAGLDLVMAPQVKAVYGDIGTPDTNPNNDVVLSPSRDYGALIRVSTGDAVKVIRENVDTSAGGLVSIGANATLNGGNALLIDATGDTAVASSARLSGAAMSLASGRISFGGGSSGLVLSAASLAQLADTQALTLRSYSTMDFYTSVDLGRAGLGTVTFDAAGLVGYGSGAIVVAGDTVVLENLAGTFVSPGAVGNVQLSLNANDIVLGGGAKTLRGFDAVTLTAGRQVRAQGSGSLDAGAAAVTLLSPVVTGRGGASQSITTQNAIRVTRAGGTPVDNAEASLGTRLAFTGTSVDMDGRIVALGGAVNLTATAGNVTVAPGGLIDVSGFRKQFYDVAQFADAGSIALTAVGSVVVASGGHLNLSAHAEGGAAGKLSLTASNGGTVVLGGSIEAHARAGEKGGSFALDIAALPDFAGMSQLLNVSGFSASRQFRIRSGSVVIDGLTEVADFALVADQGTVTLAGTIDARAPYGGNISISAGNGLTMQASALLRAGATGEFGGGRVILEASGGRMDVAGGTIDVSGAAGGRVRFRAQQIDAHQEIAVDRLQAVVVGARSAVLEGVSIENGDAGSVDAVRGGAITNATTFASHAAAIAARLNAGGIAVMPGIEIRSSGDLTLETDWNLAADFASVRMGSLTLRATGNLTLLGNLSDGFSAADTSGVLQDMSSWDLRLVAGADLTSAGALTVRPLAALPAASGSLTIGDAASGKIVRTGTGDIDVVAGRDLLLAHNTSAIYTAGRADPTLYADFQRPANATYGIDGGNLRIVAQGDATSMLPIGRSTDTQLDDNQLFTEWLRKVGSLGLDLRFEPGLQTSWWIDYGKFQQGVGALGGGNVSVSTGGDLVNMLVALPTNGRVRGGESSTSTPMQLELRNGGLMQVDAGGTLRAGYYYVGRGDGVINASEFANGRTVSAVLYGGREAIFDIAPVLALGDAAMKVKTTGDLVLQTVLDPLMLNSDNVYGGGSSRNSAYMSGYGERTSLDLLSVGGDVSLTNQGRYLSKEVDISGGTYGLHVDYSYIGLFATNLYPSVTRIAALNGSVISHDRFFTAPGSTPELRILADNDIVLGEITMARANVAMMPSPFLPIGGVGGGWLQLRSAMSGNEFQSLAGSGLAALLLNEFTIGYSMTLSAGSLMSYLESVRNPAVLENAADMEPSRIFARNGSITGSMIATTSVPKLARITTNEQTWFRAGRDIRNIDYDLRNVHRTDVSLLDAGNDIIGIGGRIEVQGPGAISLVAGRDVYGTTFEVISNGNYDAYQTNRAVELSEVKGLPRDGAGISVLAGLQGRQPDYEAFAAMYLDPAHMAAMPNYLKATDGETVLPIHLINGIDIRSATSIKMQRGVQLFVAEMTGELLRPVDAWNRFQTLPRLTQERFIREAYMQELSTSGDNQLTLDINGRPLNGGYNRGYKAIETLFPGSAWKGDIKLGNGTLRTMAGGGIETFTPGGGLQVAALGTVVPDGAGLVTLGYGDINTFARDNVTVNRSRVLTFAGGDVTIWSSLGDIDAGRGAKTTRVPSAPEITTDEDGVTKVQERADIGGSGIGTIIGFTGVEPGDVSLIAPEGTVDAGDAGIRVSGNFVVAALQVLNAENIKVDGEKKGIPKVESVSLNMTVQTKDKAAEDATRDATQNKGSERPSVIIVEVLGYGGGNAAPSDEDTRRQRDDRRSYDTNSVIQLVGNGALNQQQSEALTDDERRRLQDIARAARGR
jgi:filamentous hemagglutinin family protein